MNDLNRRLPSELDARGPDLTATHLTSSWTVQELEACFVVIDSSGQKLAFVYHRDEPSPGAAKLPTQRPSAPDRGEHREAAGVTAEGLAELPLWITQAVVPARLGLKRPLINSGPIYFARDGEFKSE